MRAYLDAKTPEDPALDTVDAFKDFMRRAIEAMPLEMRAVCERRGWVANAECAEVIERVSRAVGLHQKTVRSHLKQLGWAIKSDGTRGYRIDRLGTDGADDDATF